MACNRYDCLDKARCSCEDGCDCSICKSGSWTVSEVLDSLGMELYKVEEIDAELDSKESELSLCAQLEMTAAALISLSNRLTIRATMIRRAHATDSFG